MPNSIEPLTTVTLNQLHALPNPHLAAALGEDYSECSNLPARYTFNWHHLNRGRYAEHALIAQTMTSIDPRNGNILHSRCAWVLPGDWLGIAYEFEGTDKFFLITSSFDQAKLGIWFPRTSLFVAGRVDPNWVKIGVATVEALRSHLASAHPWEKYAPITTDGKSGVLHLGFCNNLGHYMWNDLAGLEAVLQASSENRIDTIIIGPHEFFPVDSIYPEFSRVGIALQRWPKPLPECVKHSGTLPLRVAGNRISHDLRRRIVAWALQESIGSLGEIERYNDRALNLWFNLRCHNKMWVGQVEGITAIVGAVQSWLPATQSIRIFLDGTPDTCEISNDIAMRLNGKAEVVNATRVPLFQTITYATLIDLHVCVIGSGLTLPHWVMGRRGIAHSNRLHLGQQSMWNNVATDAHDMTFVPERAITDHKEPTTPDASYVNYDMSVSSVLDLLHPLYRQQDGCMRMSGVTQMLSFARKNLWDQAAERVISI